MMRSIQLLNANLASAKARQNAVFPFCKTPLLNRLMRFPHQPEIKRKIMNRRQLERQDLLHLEEVAKISSTEILARVTRALGIHR